MADASKPDYLNVDGNPIAYRALTKGAAPTLVWLGGYRSDMLGTKAERMEGFARSRGLKSLRLDYSGHGESGGDFLDGTISLWAHEARTVIETVTEGRLILCGSSMGAWVTLLIVKQFVAHGLTDRLQGLVLLAPAPDFTVELMEPELSDADRRMIEETGQLEEPSEYSPDPNIFTAKLFEDGRANRLMDGILDTHCPVHILQGMADPDVPYTHALKLLDHLPADNVTMTLIKDGDHRLSREQDLVLFEKALAGLLRDAQ